MRGFAALYVLFYHLAVIGLLIQVPVIQSVQQAGWTGVSFFFVLSGYLLYGIYRNGISRSYFVRRIFRTFPLYYLSLPLYLLAGLIVFSPLYVVYGQGYIPSTFSNVPLWTLTLEELFYFVLLPLVIYLKPNRTYLLVFALALCLLWGIIAPQTDFATKQMPAWFVDYAIGMWLVDRRVPARFTALTGIAMLFAAGIFYAGHDLWPFSAVVFGAGYGLLLLGAQDFRFFTNRVAVFLGKISYGVYILQFPLLLVLGPVWGLLATLGLSALSYYTLESSFVRFAHNRFQ